MTNTPDTSLPDRPLKVTLIKSIYGHSKAHQATVRGLGLRRIRDTVSLQDTPEIRGMLSASRHLLKVEET